MSSPTLQTNGPAQNSSLNEKSNLEDEVQTPSDVVATQQLPEGGLRGWLTVMGGALVTFCTFGVVQSFGVYQDYYQRVYLTEHTPSEISWIGSVQTFWLFTIGLISGRLFDAGYFHHCVLSGSLIYTFSLFMLSLAKPHHYYQNFLSQGCGMGIGMGFMFLPCLTLTSHYFQRKRSLAMGIVVAGSSVGAVVHPILLNNVFEKADFGWGVRAMGFLDLAVLIVANLIMRTRPTAGRRTTKQPIRYSEILKDVPYLVFVFGSFLVFWGTFVPFFYLQVYANVHQGVPRTLVKYSLSIMNIASIFGRTVPNFLADHLGALNVMIPSAIITSGLLFAMLAATNVSGVVLFGILYGLFSGSCISICSPAAARFSTRQDHSDLGIRMGVLSFCLGFALLTGNPIAGALLTPRHIWTRPLIFASVVTFAGGVCYLMVWRSLSARRGTKLI